VTARAVLFIVHGDEEVFIGRITTEELDLSLIDAIARLQLAARRMGCSLRLREASIELCRLIDLAGLSACLDVEARREAEGLEQLGVQEVVDTGDPTA